MDRRVRYALMVFAVVLIAVCIRVIFRFDARRSLVTPQDTQEEREEAVGKLEQVFSDGESDSDDFFYVLILGAVQNPGDYRILKGQTLGELIDKAGGTLPGAKTEELDMGYLLQDNDFFYIEGPNG